MRRLELRSLPSLASLALETPMLSELGLAECDALPAAALAAALCGRAAAGEARAGGGGGMGGQGAPPRAAACAEGREQGQGAFCSAFVTIAFRPYCLGRQLPAPRASDPLAPPLPFAQEAARRPPRAFSCWTASAWRAVAG